MSASLAFVDVRPSIKPRGDMVELHIVSGDQTHSFVLTRHAALNLGLRVEVGLAKAGVNLADVIPLTKKRRKAKRIAKEAAR